MSSSMNEVQIRITMNKQPQYINVKSSNITLSSSCNTTFRVIKCSQGIIFQHSSGKYLAVNNHGVVLTKDKWDALIFSTHNGQLNTINGEQVVIYSVNYFPQLQKYFHRNCITEFHLIFSRPTTVQETPCDPCAIFDFSDDEDVDLFESQPRRTRTSTTRLPGISATTTIPRLSSVSCSNLPAAPLPAVASVNNRDDVANRVRCERGNAIWHADTQTCEQCPHGTYADRSQGVCVECGNVPCGFHGFCPGETGNSAPCSQDSNGRYYTDCAAKPQCNGVCGNGGCGAAGAFGWTCKKNPNSNTYSCQLTNWGYLVAWIIGFLVLFALIGLIIYQLRKPSIPTINKSTTVITPLSQPIYTAPGPITAGGPVVVNISPAS